MNKNIEIITPDLLGVNVEWLKLGYIKEFKIIPDRTLAQINLTDSGKIILDKNSKIYDVLKNYFTKAMTYTDSKLIKLFTESIRFADDKGIDFLQNIYGFEIQRRYIKKHYLEEGKEGD